jgi:hypothetical protein
MIPMVYGTPKSPENRDELGVVLMALYTTYGVVMIAVYTNYRVVLMAESTD